MRDLMVAAAGLVARDPAHAQHLGAWQRVLARARSMAAHTVVHDARHVQFHYDLSDDFYALWLDPRRVYSCAYFRVPGMDIAQAQEAKLDHICRKLRLAPGERFLDIGAGWGGLLLWAAEHYGVDATGITLSRNQHAHVQRLVQWARDEPLTASALLARHLDSGGPSVHVNTLVAKLKASGLVCKHTRHSLKKAEAKKPFAKQL